MVKERIICEYLSVSKTVQMLSEEYGMSRNAINHLISRHRSKFSPTFEAHPILPAMSRKKTTEETTEKLLQENRELR
ncbi:hypothetical protein EZS27_032440, partial [termite gut metagenome]